MNSVKRHKDRTLKDELPRLVGTQYATEEEWGNKSRKNEDTSKSKNNAQLSMWWVMEVESNVIINNIA